MTFRAPKSKGLSEIGGDPEQSAWSITAGLRAGEACQFPGPSDGTESTTGEPAKAVEDEAAIVKAALDETIKG